MNCITFTFVAIEHLWIQQNNVKIILKNQLIHYFHMPSTTSHEEPRCFVSVSKVSRSGKVLTQAQCFGLTCYLKFPEFNLPLGCYTQIIMSFDT